LFDFFLSEKTIEDTLLLAFHPQLSTISPSTGYLSVASSDTVYRVDLINGSATAVTAIPGAGLNTVSLASSTIAYTNGFTSNDVYYVNLTDGNFSTVAHIPGALLSRILLVNETTAYTVGFGSQDLYLVNLTNGNFSTLANLTGNPNGIAVPFSIKNSLPTTAYVIGNASGKLYNVNLTNGSFTTLAHIGGNPTGLALANNTTAYTTDGNGNIYSINLDNGTVSIAASIPGATLDGIALANSTTAYTVDMISGAIYAVNLTNGSFSLVTSSIPGANHHGIALVLQIGTEGLSGNNLNFATYLNDNAPFVVPLFALQPDIPNALQSAIPTRNAISTFASQTTQMAFGQTVYNHLTERRLTQKQPLDRRIALNSHTAPCNSRFDQGSQDHFEHLQNLKSTPIGLAKTPNRVDKTNNQSGTDYSDTSSHNSCTYDSVGCEKEKLFSPWLGTFGEFAYEKAQHQTPAFRNSSVGFVSALDYYGSAIYSTPLIGGGIAYAYTHVHEEKGTGHANINQAAIVCYAAHSFSEWNFDLAVWGGYYHTDNARNIVLPGIGNAQAKSDTNGWQLTPHFGFGYTYRNDWFAIEPFEMIDWVICWEKGFSEHGAGILNMGQKSRTCSLCRNELGIRFVETLFYDWGTITFHEKTSYVYQKTFHTGVISAFLLGSPGSFTVSTLTGAQNLGVVEVSALFIPCKKKYPYGSIGYQGEIGSHYQSHQAIITIGFDI